MNPISFIHWLETFLLTVNPETKKSSDLILEIKDQLKDVKIGDINVINKSSSDKIKDDIYVTPKKNKFYPDPNEKYKE